jgi:hypothetical protein
LGSEIHYSVKAMVGEQAFDGDSTLQCDVAKFETAPTSHRRAIRSDSREVDAEFSEPSSFQTDVVIVVEGIDADDFLPAIDQGSAKMVADKARGTGDQDGAAIIHAKHPR